MKIKEGVQCAKSDRRNENKTKLFTTTHWNATIQN
jgi:hypothetical protein